MSIRWSGITSWYRVRYLSGDQVDVQVRIPDVLRWERNNDGRSLLAGQTVGAMLTCVWYALRRERRSDVATFDEWAGTVDDFAQLDEAGEGEDPDPTSTDQSAG